LVNRDLRAGDVGSEVSGARMRLGGALVLHDSVSHDFFARNRRTYCSREKANSLGGERGLAGFLVERVAEEPASNAAEGPPHGVRIERQ
jgi:hypothetical protein